jgi:hypothetical protein
MHALMHTLMHALMHTLMHALRVCTSLYIRSIDCVVSSLVNTWWYRVKQNEY